MPIHGFSMSAQVRCTVFVVTYRRVCCCSVLKHDPKSELHLCRSVAVPAPLLPSKTTEMTYVPSGGLKDVAHPDQEPRDNLQGQKSTILLLCVCLLGVFRSSFLLRAANSDWKHFNRNAFEVKTLESIVLLREPCC